MRVYGYYLMTNGRVDEGTKYQTKRKVYETALEMLPLLKERNKKQKVGIVRAKDMVLLMTVSQKHGQITVEKL